MILVVQLFDFIEFSDFVEGTVISIVSKVTIKKAWFQGFTMIFEGSLGKEKAVFKNRDEIFMFCI